MATTTLNLSIEKGIAERIKSFSIDNVNIPADFDYKKELADARNEKFNDFRKGGILTPINI